MPRSARAQLYVVEYYAGKVSEYDATTGAAINPNFIPGLSYPLGLALSSNDLFVANYGGSTVPEYNATTGAAINRDTGTLFALTAIRQQR
jgi:hypothetical protein